MSKTMKRSIAVLLVWLQIVLLLTAALPRVLAVDDPAQDAPTALPDAAAMGAGDTELPALNETIVDYLQFSTFNYTAADENTGMEGADYSKAFVYTDDYFASSAMQPSPAKTLDWDKLENPSLVTASNDFSLACFGSNEEIESPKNYQNYSKNGEEYLRKCGFEQIVVNNDVTNENAYNVMPTEDSIGVVIGMKDIRVWNGQENQNYKLIAVGIRGAGYGAEWASNITIGDTGRHQGFQDSAVKVQNTLKQYLQDKGVTAADNVKYWVVGYSRSGAVANLVAGEISENKAVFFADKSNVYGYTFEAAAAALTTEDPDGSRFANIHNIINKMDAVPRVSPSEFGHARLGVDYLMPYHVNTSPDENTNYYQRMYEILKTVAVGYGGEDPAVTNADPSKYPYNRKVDVYELSLAQLALDVVGSNAGNLGLKKFADDTDGKGEIVPAENGQYRIFIDDFLDKLVERFAKSRAWDYNTRPQTDDPLVHRQKFVSQGYQQNFRTLIGAVLTQPGISVNTLMNKFSVSLGFGNVARLSKPVTSITEDINALDKGKSTRWSFTHLDMVDCVQDGGENLATILNYFIDQTNMFTGSQLTNVHSAVQNVSPILFGLFARDHATYSAQYTGTLLKYAMDTILVTHAPEIAVSWDMSIDDNYISDYREVTVPLDTDVKMYEFRDGFERDALSASGTGALVAEVRSGAFVTLTDPRGVDKEKLDQRITVATAKQTDEHGNLIDVQTIRYPANLNLRFDLTTASARSDTYVSVQDYQPRNGVSIRTQDNARKANGNLNGSAVVWQLDPYATSEADALNTLTQQTDISLSDKDTLHILSERDTNQLRNAVDGDYAIEKSVYVNVIVEGQLREDPDGSAVYLDRIMDASGFYKDGDGTALSDAEAAAQYVSNRNDGHMGSDFTVTMQPYGAENKIGWIRVTDAADDNNRRLTAGAQGLPAGFEPVDPTTLTLNYQSDNSLTMTDRVWHVIYTGDVYYPAESRVVDFGTTTLMKSGVAKEVDDTANAGGTFDKTAASALTFTPAQTTGENAYDVSAFSGVNKDYYYYTQTNTADVWRQMNAVPASNIYFNDPVSTDLTDHTKTTVLESSKGPDGKVDKTTSLDITFFGTAIDAYCTCDKNAGWVRAEILKDGAPVDGVKPKLMGNAYEDGANGALYNAPTIHFEGLSPDTYTLRLTAAYGRDYHLDGVRVYNTAADKTVEDLRAEHNDGGARYVNVRDLLLKDTELQDNTQKEGAAFFVMGEDGASFETYKTEGPKREVYLVQAGQGIAFTVSNPAEVNVAVGLRCADAASGTVKLNGADTPVNGTDTYYTVTPQNGKVTIEYGGSGKIAVTYIKLTDKVAGKFGAARAMFFAPADLQDFLSDLLDAPAVPDPVTPDPVTPDPTVKPVWKDVASEWSALLKLLLSSLETLFAGLGKW